MTIKNQLQKYRRQAGYKQDDGAAILHISTRQYRKIEAETPKAVIQFYLLAKSYNTTIDALLEQGGETEK